MLPQFFLKTKLLPPRLGRRVLPRPRLVERIRGFLDQPATIVCADAGCGKTTLVTEFVRSSSLPFVWYQIDPTDVDLAVFFGYVIHGIRSLHPEFGQVVLRFISETENLASKTDQLVDVFVNEVGEQIEQKTIVVLDDYHHVDSSEPIAASIDRVVQYIPDVLHIVITSRTMPNLSVTRLRSKGLIGVVDRKDLLFTPAEVRKLFAETFHQSLAPAQVDQFYEKTDGWVTGLQLIQQSLDHATEHHDSKAGAETKQSREWLAAAFQQSELDIFDYFAEEVLQSEPTETRLMLGKISLLERIDPSICEAALGIRDCADQLRALARRNVFMSQTYASGTDEEYRLHPLFRGFLNHWLASELGPDEIKRLHKDCASYFASAARWDLAVNHLADAGAKSDVAELLAARGSELVESGRLETIKRTFDQLSEESLSGRPRALIARADVALIEGNHTRALGLYAQAARMARGSNDSGVEAEALRGQAYIARYGSDCELAVKLATSAIELAPQLHALRARCFNTIGLCCFRSAGQTDRAIENWQAALKEAREAGDDRFARIVLHNLGLPYSMEGDFNEALHWLSQMIESRTAGTADSNDAQVPFPQEAIAHLNIARLKIVQGKLDEAEAHLGLALARCQLFNLRSAAAETFEAFGNLYRERGDYNRSLEFYDEAARAYRDAGVALTDRELLDEKASLYLRMGDTSAAERESDEYFRARASGSPSERSTALITRGRIQMAAGRPDKAEPILTEAAALASENKLRYNEARAALSLALLYWDAKRKKEALAQLNRAVELAVRYDYSYLLSSKAAASPRLFRAAIEAEIAPDYLTRIVPAEAVEVAAAAVVGVSSIGVASVVQPVIERPSYDLAINMLGPVEVFRDPSGMEKEVWRLSKALHILCYLCSRRNHRAPKETLVDLFWSDAEEETVSKNFHPTISHLRKALNSGQVVKRDFVLFREGAYLLNPQHRYRLDTEEFERLLTDAREARRAGGDGSAELLAEAIKLYRGDFLEEFYYNWIEELQSYYRDLYLEALKELIAHHSERNDHELVIRYGQMLLARDPYQEDVHCSVMEAYVQSGNRAAAIEQFDGLRKMLRSELGVDPLPATLAKYEALIK